MINPVLIREAEAADFIEAGRIHSLSWVDSHRSFCSEQFLSQHTPEKQANYLREEVKKGKKLYLLFTDRPIGLVTVFKDLIENLYLLPEEQKKGYGRQLLFFAMSKCEKKPRLYVLSNNDNAILFYQHFGFLFTGKEHRLSRTLSEKEMVLD
jgi:ribosomal protein S18 acetylase RimI-like enzyme